MIGKDQNPIIGELTRFKRGVSGNPNGRPKGRKSLSTIIRELEEESFNWELFPKKNKELQDFIEALKPIGSPFRAIVYRAVIDALVGKGPEKIAAREFLRRAGYGNKVETPDESQIRETREPIIMTHFKPRFNNSQ
jgi:hypothetical protein